MGIKLWVELGSQIWQQLKKMCLSKSKANRPMMDETI